jgi:hypothetical protein
MLDKMMEDEILAFGRIEAWSLEEELGMTTEEIKVWQDSLGFDNIPSPDDSSFDDADEESVIVDNDHVSCCSIYFSDWVEGELYSSQVPCGSFDDKDASSCFKCKCIKLCI